MADATQQRDLLLFYMKGDRDAVSFVETVYAISQVLDDLVDQDKPINRSDVMEMAWDVFGGLLKNRFFLAHSHELQPTLEDGLMLWMDSTVLETQGAQERVLAFVFRDVIGGIAIKCARIIGGYEWSRTVSLDVHKRISHDESLDDYLQGLTHYEREEEGQTVSS